MSNQISLQEEDDEREFEAAMQAIRENSQAEVEKNIKWLTDQEAAEYKECSKSYVEQKIDSLKRERVISCLGRLLYHEAPDDIMELIVSTFASKNGIKGYDAMNVLRLVSKRLKRMVETVVTRLTNTRGEDGPDSFPISLLSRCGRIEHIRCDSHNISSLEGCPDGLKSLHIANGQHLASLEPLRGCTGLESLRVERESLISDLSPLAGCTRLKSLILIMSNVTNISVLASFPNLEALSLMKLNQPSIKDLSPLLQCRQLKWLLIFGNSDVEDLSPLLHLSNLAMLDIGNIPVDDLKPLAAALPKLDYLGVKFIPDTTSLLPLEQCRSLRKISCDNNAKDLALLQVRMPHVKFDMGLQGDEGENDAVLVEVEEEEGEEEQGEF